MCRAVLACPAVAPGLQVYRPSSEVDTSFNINILVMEQQEVEEMEEDTSTSI